MTCFNVILKFNDINNIITINLILRFNYLKSSFLRNNINKYTVFTCNCIQKMYLFKKLYISIPYLYLLSLLFVLIFKCHK